MRILYVLNTLAVGGTERQVLAIASRMATRGHTVSLLVLRGREASWFPTELNVVSLEARTTLGGAISVWRRARMFMGEFRPDIIHSHNFHGNMLARCLRLFERRPKLVCTIHNVYEGGGLRMMAYRLSDPLAHLTTAVSRAVAKRFERLHAVKASKCVVVTNGIDTKEFIADTERRARVRREMGVGPEFVWIAVGRITAAKDLPNLLRAFEMVRSEASGVRLWIAGNGADEDIRNLETECSKLNSRRAAQWIGPRSDIPALLDAADAFVLSSAWEGMPLALGEAMAMEKPVVATDVGGVSELVGEAGMIVPVRDPGALGKAMLHLMRLSPQQRAAMGRAGRERICALFDIDRKAAEWEVLYKILLRGQSHRPEPRV